MAVGEEESIAVVSTHNGSRSDRLSLITSANAAYNDLLVVVRSLGLTASPFLLVGEFGTGKKTLARYLHEQSRNASQRFSPISAMDSHALNEIWHALGNGASRDHSASSSDHYGPGTVYIEDVDALPMAAQDRLLTTLSNIDQRVVAGFAHVPRLVAGTSVDLELRTRQGKFDARLFGRLCRIQFHVPPLRERREDVLPMLTHYAQASRSRTRCLDVLGPQMIDYLSSTYSWPGNINELKTVGVWLANVSRAKRNVRLMDLMPPLLGYRSLTDYSDDWTKFFRTWISDRCAVGAVEELREVLPTVERLLIEGTLDHTRGCRHKAAKVLGIGRNTLAKKIGTYEIDRRKFVSE